MKELAHTKFLCRDNTTMNEAECLDGQGHLQTVCHKAWSLHLDKDRLLANAPVEFHGTSRGVRFRLRMRHNLDEWHNVRWVKGVSDKNSARVNLAVDNKL